MAKSWMPRAGGTLTISNKVVAWFTSPLLSFLFRLFLGGIFVYAGIVKIVDPHGFALALYNYKLLPGWMVNPVAIILPWVEVITGGSLLLGFWVQGGGLIVFGLLWMFACALGINLARGLDIACGCFSTSTSVAPIT
jgi:uncharacterized membrane protein YphA (DoxX/SURF4 family)